MGICNYLVEGASGTGKTSVCHALTRRGYHAVNADRVLAYKGDPDTGQIVSTPTGGSETEGVLWEHAHHVWDLEKLKGLIADRNNAMTFICGGARNLNDYLDWFDGVFILEIDRDTLLRRLHGRPKNEFGGRESERALILQRHTTKEDLPRFGDTIDATQDLEHVVNQILAKCG